MVRRNTPKFFLAFASLFFTFLTLGQTLIINEVSNGPTGSQEYVEFVVVDATAVYDCSGSAPPCIDIRGWIFDDNSGYHGSTGVAAGAVRFSNDPIWECIPLGTIIVIYNDDDPNISISGSDVDMADGNCTLMVPLNDQQYFEFTNTTPGDISCSYPTSGWGSDSSPTWTSNTAFANGGDCARLVDLNGCEVFSLCYGSANANPMIYFSGSGSDDVWYFNDGDPFLQSNWSEGCAGDIAACGSNDQTPGSPNNAANAAYIAQFNNGCAPIPPLVASVTSSSGCGCTGTGTASATGSIPGYTYEWFDDSFNPIGQSSATATGLCSGTYNAIVTSSIGCEDTVQITITPTGSDDPGTNGVLDTCASLTGNVNLFDYLGGTPDNTGTWSGPSITTGSFLGTIDLSTASTGTYTYTVGSSPCTASADVVLSYSALPVVTATGNDITCNGSNNGDVDASATGVSPFSYSWDNGLGAGAAHSGLAPNTYTVTVTDGNGCTNTDAITLNEPTPLTATIAPVSVSCNGDCDGVATVTLGGGSGSYTYTWDNTTTDNTATTQANLCATTYNVTVADAVDASCTTTASVTVTEPVVITLSETNTPANCGAADGTATITASGGSGVYTDYNWSPAPGGGQGTANATGLAAGSYTVTVTDDNNCTATLTVNISNSSAPTITEFIASHIDVSCNGLADGAAEVSVSGGTAPLSIAWSPGGGSSNSASGLTAGTYTVTVTDGNTCSSSVTIDITEPTPLTVSSSGTDAHCSQNDGTVTSTISGGTTSYAYNWYSDATLTTPAGSGSSLANLSAGDYYLEVIDGNGCSIIDQVTIVDLAGPSVSATVNADATNAVTCDGDASASVSGGTGTITFVWDNSNSNANANDLCIGNNCVTVTDDFGCTDVDCITILNSTGITLSLIGIDPTCNDLCDGSIDATITNATAPITYSWTSGQSTEDLTNLCSGTYDLTVTDGLGQTATASITLINPDTMSIQTNNLSEMSCFGVCDGEIDIIASGGTGSLSLLWTEATLGNMGSSANINSLCAGSYNINITDFNGCTFDSIYVITEPTEIATITSSSNSNCGAADGGVSVIASGGTVNVSYTYEWTDVNGDPVGNVNNVNGVSSGTYYVTVYDDNLCPALDSVDVNDVIPNISIIEDSSAVSCFGLSDGSLDLVITSPNSYSIDWAGPNGFSSTLENLSNLAAGTYLYEFSDNNGCTILGQIIVDEPVQLILNLTVDSTTCDIACDGAITATGVGGVSPYTYSSTFPSWTNGAPDLCIGVYTIILTDDNGCSVSIDTLLDHDDNRPDPSITLTDLDYCLDEGSFSIPTQTAGGTWTTNGTGIIDPLNGIFSPSAAGIGSEQIIYTFSGICGDADTVNINVHQLEDASFSMISSLCENDTPTDLTPINTGGTWQGTGVNSSTMTFDPSVSGAGAFTVSYIINGQCPDTVSQQITVNPTQNPIISTISPQCLDAGNVQLNASIPGGVWSGVSNSSGVINTTTLGAGIYEVYYTIQSQCGDSDTLDIIINDLPSLDITVSDTLGCAPLTISFSDLNSVVGNSYSWTSDGTSISSNANDTYTFTDEGCVELAVSVVDANGCTNSMTFPSQICTEPFPIANFEYDPSNPTTYDYLVDVSNLSMNADGYQWSMDGVDFSFDTDVHLNFNGYEPGGYFLCLTASNYLGCSHTFCDSIFLEDEFAMYIPNTFTPNGNGQNESFGPVYSGEQPEEISFMIFNRWGQLIYEVNSLDEFWDGNYLGQPAVEDVYIWKIKYKLPESTERRTLIGHVNLIR